MLDVRFFRDELAKDLVKHGNRNECMISYPRNNQYEHYALAAVDHIAPGRGPLIEMWGPNDDRGCRKEPILSIALDIGTVTY